MGERRLGFTLVEVLAALVLSAMVVLMVSRLFAVTTASVKALEAARESLDREQNGRDWLRAAFGSLEAGDSLGGFDGEPERVTFTAWLEQPEGWFAPRRVVVRVSRGSLVAEVAEWRDGGQADGRNSVTYRPPVLPPYRLCDSVTSLDLDYLLDPGANSHWVRQWISPLSAPLAVRLRVGRRAGTSEGTDTLLILIGVRG